VCKAAKKMSMLIVYLRDWHDCQFFHISNINSTRICTNNLRIINNSEDRQLQRGGNSPDLCIRLQRRSACSLYIREINTIVNFYHISNINS
jgi:hypothetical protein